MNEYNDKCDTNVLLIKQNIALKACYLELPSFFLRLFHLQTMTYHQSSANINFQRKSALRLCSESPRISAFERQLSLIKTPVVMQNNNSPPLMRRSVNLISNSNERHTSPTESLSNLSDATLVGSGNNLIGQTNSLKRIEVNNEINSVTKIPISSEEKRKTEPMSLKFKIPMNEINAVKNEVEFFVRNVVETLHSITKRDVDTFLNHLAEVIIGVFVVFGGEILHLNKEAFLTLVQMVVVCVIRIGLKSSENDSLMFQSSIISVLEIPALPVRIKRSVTRLITTLQFYILFSTLRITFIFKKNYVDDESKVDSLTIMGLGLVMVLLCLNLIINSLPASRHYNEINEIESTY